MTENSGHSSSHHPDMTTEREGPFAADKDAFSGLGVILFIGVGLFSIFMVVWDAFHQKIPQPLTNRQDIAYQMPPLLKGPHIQVEDVQDSSVQEQQHKNAEEKRLRAAALELAREAQERLRARRESSQLIVDRSYSAMSGIEGSEEAFQSDRTTPLKNSSSAEIGQATDTGGEKVAARQVNDLSSLIAQGTIIDAVMETALQSDLPGMLRAVVSEDVYSFDGRNVLLPKGSRLIGQYRNELKRGQARVFVIWTRALRPDGVSVDLAAPGTDDLGKAGLTGKIDTHFFQRFGASALLSILDAGLQAGVNTTRHETARDITLHTGHDLSNASELALENSIAIPPTITVEHGSRIKVFVARDLDFSKAEKDIRKNGS